MNPQLESAAFDTDVRGAVAAEYALILAILAAGIVGATLSLGAAIGDGLNSAAAGISSAGNLTGG